MQQKKTPSIYCPFLLFGVFFKMRWKYSLALDSLKVSLNLLCHEDLHRVIPGALVGKAKMTWEGLQDWNFSFLKSG